MFRLNTPLCYLTSIFIIDRFYTTVNKFISWVCYKFGLGDSKELIRDFERENDICMDPVKQIAKEEREKEWEMEL